jgi:hypothetical protein
MVTGLLFGNVCDYPGTIQVEATTLNPSSLYTIFGVKRQQKYLEISH